MESKMPDIEYEKCFKTTDLYFAAFLKVADIPFVDCVPKEGANGRKEFLFENVEGLRDLKQVWFRSEAVKISPLRYSREIQTLKAMTYM